MRHFIELKMKQINRQIFHVITLLILTSCNETSEKKSLTKIETVQAEKPKFIPNEKFLTKHSDSCGCSAEFELKHSFKLEKIKDQFYKSKTGHLYEKTWSQQELEGQDTLSWVLYFNGVFSQEVDPITFEALNGWYAKDKNNIYYYRPVSGGMQISKLEKADTKTFEILQGHYKYGVDKNHFYDATEIIENYVPSRTKLTFDHKKRVVKMTSNTKTYKFETVN